MTGKKFGVFVVLLIAVVFLLSGCGSGEEVSSVKVESGTVDENYSGVVNPEVPKEVKISEEEAKNGVQKVTIKCGVQKEIPVDTFSSEKDNIPKPAEEKGASDEARPKI